MMKEELNEIEIKHDLPCNEINTKTSASSCWMMGIFFLGLKRKAHHPREATLGSKNKNIPVGAILIARKNKMQPLHRGITLISLVITIIILLILAGVTLNLTISENGIFKLASNASKNYENKAEQENFDLAQANNKIENYIGGTRNNFTQYKKIGTYNSGVQIDISQLDFEELFIIVDGTNPLNYIILRDQLSTQEKTFWFDFHGAKNIISGHLCEIVGTNTYITLQNVWSVDSGNNPVSMTNSYQITLYYR